MFKSNLQNKDTVNGPKLLIIKLMITVLRGAFENFQDSKQQFNSLLLLDQLFATVFGGPNLDTELKFIAQYKLNKDRRDQRASDQILDITDVSDETSVSLLSRARKPGAQFPSQPRLPYSAFAAHANAAPPPASPPCARKRCSALRPITRR